MTRNETLFRVLLIPFILTFLFCVMSILAVPGHAASAAQGGVTTIRGKLDILQFDDFARGRAPQRLFVTDKHSGEQFEVFVSGKMPSSVKGGDEVEVRGRRSGTGRNLDVNLAAADGSNGIAVTESIAQASVSGTRSVLVLMMDSNDSVASCSASQVNDMMFSTTASSVGGMYKQASGGGFGLSGAVYDHVKINVTSSGLCDYSGWGSQALSAAQGMGINTSGYGSIIYVLPSNASCGWAGLGSMPGSSVWIPGRYCNYPDVFAHELGHNIGMHHARSGGSEYGDTSDFMGYGGVGLRMLNAAHKSFNAWVPAAQATAIKPGVTTLAPLYSVGASSPVLGTIPKSDTGQTYFLGYRTYTGYDSASNLPSGYVDRLNIHTQSGGYSDFVAALSVGQAYDDVANGLRIEVVALDGGAATVNVSAVCNANPPSVSISPASQGGSPGQTLSYTVTVTNRDSAYCGNSVFNLGSNLDAGLSGGYSVSSLSLAPSASASAVLSVTSASSLSGGTFGVTALVSDSASAAHGGSASASYVIDAEAPSVPSGLLASQVRKGINLSWSASSDNVGVAGYDIFRDGVKVGSSAYNSYRDRASRGSHNYQVRAYDSAGNVSGLSAPVTILVK